jgi:hypothetical protein
MIDQWHEFFVMVGGGAAVLAGLVFIAMAENVKAIVFDITHKSRAIGTLAGFTSVFVICGLALMADQNLMVVGIEWLIVSSTALGIYLNGIFQSRKQGRSVKATGLTGRILTGSSLYALQMVGAFVMILNNVWGLYIASVAMLIGLAYMISGAWLLIVGVNQENKAE